MRWLALVRNVMIGREGLHREVLLKLVEAAGGTNPRSFLTTGNLAFSTQVSDIDRVVNALEEQIQGVLGRHEPVIVRSMDWLGNVVSAERFSGYEDQDWELEVCFLPHSAPKILSDRLGDSKRTVLVEIRDRELLTARPPRGADRPHGNRLLERATGHKATARGWLTLQRIHAHDVV